MTVTSRFVNFLEFRLFSLSGTRSSRQFGVEQEEVLVGNAGQGLGLGLNFDVLFGFNGLGAVPSLQRDRPGITRSVNSSTITISPLRTM